MLADLVDPARLSALVDQRFITCRHHPSEPLRIYDYTPKASYTGTWTPETRLCRGLIVHDDGTVAARPFAKFFNLGELPEVPAGQHDVFEKLDGSLGILYACADGWAISTRGAFTSAQAQWASAHWQARYRQWQPEPGCTYVFEIIYPENRIVVDYGPFAGLVLLAVLDNETGADRPLPPEWPGPVVRRCEVDPLAGGTPEIAREQRRPCPEGFVVRFAAAPGRPSLRVKVKDPEYLRLHRIVTRVSRRTIWEHLAAGRELDELLDRVPDEFAAWARATAGELRRAYGAVEDACRRALADRRVDPGDRAATAAYFAGCGADPVVLWKMLDGRPYEDIIWRRVRPPADRPYRVDLDAAG
jgi:RNA ligase